MYPSSLSLPFFLMQQDFLDLARSSFFSSVHILPGRTNTASSNYTTILLASHHNIIRKNQLLYGPSWVLFFLSVSSFISLTGLAAVFLLSLFSLVPSSAHNIIATPHIITTLTNTSQQNDHLTTHTNTTNTTCHPVTKQPTQQQQQQHATIRKTLSISSLDKV